METKLILPDNQDVEEETINIVTVLSDYGFMESRFIERKPLKIKRGHVITTLNTYTDFGTFSVDWHPL